MRIGVNAQPLTNPLTGIGQYTVALLKQLIHDHPEVDWFLYTGKPLLTDFFDKMPNVTIVIYPCKNKVHRTLFIAFCMKRILERDKIDIFWSPTHILPLQKSKHIKYFMSVHDMVYKKMPQTMSFFNAIKEWLFFYPSILMADTIFALSKTTRQDLMTHFSLKKIPTLVYPAYEKPRNYLEVGTPLVPGKYILSVCTKEPRKNLDALLEAYLQLSEPLRKVYTLVFCGGRGWKSDAFMQALKDASQTQNIVNFDYVTDDERNNLYSNATVFVFPTLYEGFGLPVIEAMSYGIPVLTSDIPIMREVGEGAALYANPKDPSEIALALSNTLTNPDRLDEFSSKATQHYQFYNSWKRGADIIAKTMGLDNKPRYDRMLP